RRCEQYLRGKGAQTLYAGPILPLNPFYLGLYGGSELPGFLVSDTAAEPFFNRLGYKVFDTCMVFQRLLHETISIPDGGVAGLREGFEVCIVPWCGAASWWQECVRGPLEFIGFHLEEKGSEQVMARAAVWEMDGFTWRWNQPAVGIVNVEVR